MSDTTPTTPLDPLTGPSVLHQEPALDPGGRVTRHRLTVVRHGETLWSRQGRHTGRTDLPLEPEGVRQAEALHPLLSGTPFALVLVSPLQRARRTCALAGFAASGEVCEDLQEWDYGRDEGRTTAAIRAERPGWSVWGAGPDGGETLAAVSARADRVLERVRVVPGDVLVFAHAHILRILTARWLALPPEVGAHFVLEPAAIGVLGWERETPVLLSWNRTASGERPGRETPVPRAVS
jgi:probable phosphoglycerate mutase